jgi:hypothetical protein
MFIPESLGSYIFQYLTLENRNEYSITTRAIVPDRRMQAQQASLTRQFEN